MSAQHASGVVIQFPAARSHQAVLRRRQREAAQQRLLGASATIIAGGRWARALPAALEDALTAALIAVAMAGNAVFLAAAFGAWG